MVGEEKTGPGVVGALEELVGLANMESVSHRLHRNCCLANGSNDPMVVTAYDDNIGDYIPRGYPRGGVDRVENGTPLLITS